MQTVFQKIKYHDTALDIYMKFFYTLKCPYVNSKLILRFIQMI
jgi:hypothetical protein